ATEACRVLLANADRARNYQLFVCHDADPYGYNIGRVLREATARMPDHQAEVIDLGLKLGPALEMKLPLEKFTRKKDLPQKLYLTEFEILHFLGKEQGYGRSKSWICGRVELNAMSAPKFVEYLDGQLQKANVRGKVIPPERELRQLAQDAYRKQLSSEIALIVDEVLHHGDVEESLVTAFTPEFQQGEVRAWIERGLAER